MPAAYNNKWRELYLFLPAASGIAQSMKKSAHAKAKAFTDLSGLTYKLSTVSGNRINSKC